jgi:hypothetical protein
MKRLTILIFIFNLNQVCSQNLNSIDSIIFYDFEGTIKTENNSIVNNKGTVNYKLVSKSFRLNKSNQIVFNNSIHQKSSYGKGTASCFDPHLGIVYFSKGKPIYYLNICFSCNVLRANFDIPNQKQGKQGKGEKAYYLLDGMSKGFRLYLNNLIAKYNFSNQINKNSMFDN